MRKWLAVAASLWLGGGCSARSFTAAPADAGAHDAAAHLDASSRADASAAAQPVTLDGTYTAHFASNVPWTPNTARGTCEISLEVTLDFTAALSAVVLDPATKSVSVGPASSLSSDDTFGGGVMAGMCKSSSTITLQFTSPLAAGDPGAGDFGVIGQADGVLHDPTNAVTDPIHVVFSMDGAQFGQTTSGAQRAFEATFTMTSPDFVGSGSFGGRVMFTK